MLGGQSAQGGSALDQAQGKKERTRLWGAGRPRTVMVYPSTPLDSRRRTHSWEGQSPGTETGGELDKCPRVYPSGGRHPSGGGRAQQLSPRTECGHGINGTPASRSTDPSGRKVCGQEPREGRGQSS